MRCRDVGGGFCIGMGSGGLTEGGGIGVKIQVEVRVGEEVDRVGEVLGDHAAAPGEDASRHQIACHVADVVGDDHGGILLCGCWARGVDDDLTGA